MNYRTIWKKYNGKIPIDEFGRSYEIHHIDGNKSNNSIDNLKCVTIEEHYLIHYNQKDYFSARLIANRMNITYDELVELHNKMSNSSKGKPKKKTKCIFCNLDFSVNGINVHQITCNANPNKIKRVIPSIGDALRGKKRGPQKNRTERNTKKNNEFSNKMRLILTGTKQKQIKCPYCKKIGGNMMKVYHFDNCLMKPGNEGNTRQLTEKHKNNLRKPKQKKI